MAAGEIRCVGQNCGSCSWAGAAEARLANQCLDPNIKLEHRHVKSDRLLGQRRNGKSSFADINIFVNRHIQHDSAIR